MCLLGLILKTADLGNLGFFFCLLQTWQTTLQRLELGWLEKRKRGEKLFSLVLVGFIIM